MLVPVVGTARQNATADLTFGHMLVMVSDKPSVQ